MPSRRLTLSLYSLFGLGSVVTPVFFLNKESEKEEAPIELIDNEYDEDYDLEKLKERAEAAFKKMDDYSFKMFLPCGKFGTGWVLDYEIPTEDDYPTTWYIATNAHVANQFRFTSNDYGQELPISAESTKELRDKAPKQELAHLPLNSSEICDAENKYGYFDFNLSRAVNGKQLNSNLGAIHNKKMEEPKLFYVPIDFLDKDESKGIKENNYKDFAVIEVKFTDKEYAKEATGDFYGKYKVGSKDAINIFAAPLNKSKNWEDIEASYEDYYSLAYPRKENDIFSYTTNFDEETGQSSVLSEDRHGLSDIKGYVSATALESKLSQVMTEWNGKKLNSVGHFYLLEHFPMAGGASGGLVIDRYGNILGLRSLGGKEGSNQFCVVPLRSSEIVKDGVHLSPEYDLILGVPGQKTSYKQKILDLGRKTFLSESGWKHASQKND